MVQDMDQSDIILQKVYLQKIPYKIVENHVEEIKEQYFSPQNLMQSILSLETGQVYSVLIRDDNNNFMCLGRNKQVNFADRVLNTDLSQEQQFNENNILLVYVVNQ